jgi:hypothetical protein
MDADPARIMIESDRLAMLRFDLRTFVSCVQNIEGRRVEETIIAQGESSYTTTEAMCCP